MQEAWATEDKQGKINRHYNKGQGENQTIYSQNSDWKGAEM